VIDNTFLSVIAYCNARAIDAALLLPAWNLQSRLLGHIERRRERQESADAARRIG